MFKAKVINQPDNLIEGIPELVSVDDTSGTFLTETGTDEERIEKLAYEKGYKEGEKAGYEVGLKKAESLLRRLEEVLREIEAYKAGLQETIQEKVLSLTRAVAEAVIKEEIKARQNLMVELIKEAVRKIEPSETLYIKLHPSLKEIFEKMDGLEGLHETVKIEIDPSLTEASAKVSTQEQDVPLDIGSLVEGLMEELKERLLSNETGHSRRGD
ncbi:MAG: hypothetical protein D6778_07585 [Nitrospirae bacterium]|nr:MAG: hypothetical protein D6778_07585 [Nitrospirota bacterium]